MSEKHKPAPAEQPVAWARMKHGKIISVSYDKRVAEFLAGFAASELVPLYMRPQPTEQQPAPNVGECHKIVVWAVYDAASDRKFIKMDASTGCLALFKTEQQAAIFASDCVMADYQKLVLCQCPQPAPDISQLVEALKQILGWRELRSGQEFPIDRIEDIARNALAAYRNHGGKL